MFDRIFKRNTTPRPPEKFTDAAARVGMTLEERLIVEGLGAVRLHRRRAIAATIADRLELAPADVLDTVDRLVDARILVKQEGRYSVNRFSHTWKILRHDPAF